MTWVATDMRLPDHPPAVVGAASYFALGVSVWMRDTEGYESIIETKGSSTAALNAAKRWQENENKAVTKEAKRLAKLG